MERFGSKGTTSGQMNRRHVQDVLDASDQRSIAVEKIWRPSPAVGSEGLMMMTNALISLQ